MATGMFPRIFEATVYTTQDTICPMDIMINRGPPGYQSPSTVTILPTSSGYGNHNFEEEFCPPPSRNPPVQDYVTILPGLNPTASGSGLPHHRRDESHWKTTPPLVLGSRTPSNAQKERIKLRRKKEAKYPCPWCGDTFTIKPRVESHIKSIHFGIKDHKCEFMITKPGSDSESTQCDYATALPWDLKRHRRLKRHWQQPEAGTVTHDQLETT